jgi:hypothetical protein
MNITGYHCNGKILADSNGNWTDKLPYLGFILSSTDDVKVFYDLDRDVACILKNINLPPELGKELFEKERTLYEECKLTYFNGRLFGIDFGNITCSLSDTKQYRKTEDTIVAELVIPQVVELARIAKQTAEKVLASLQKFGLHPDKLTSPISIYEKEVMPKLNIPNYTNYPKIINDLSCDCLDGNWIEAFQVGHWNKVYDYDLNGAYPFQLSKLFDISKGTWVHSCEYQEKATYFIGYCQVTINSDFSPIAYTLTDNNSIVTQKSTPTGTFVRILNKRAIDYIKYYDVDEVEILDGYWFFRNINSPQIFTSEINRMYKFKQTGTEMDKEIAKRLYSGIWGKMQEQYKNNYNDNFRYGKFNNFFYAAEVELNTKLLIAETCIHNNIVPLYINADGFITDKELTNIKLSTELGNWKLNKTGKCFIIGDGTATIEEEKPQNMYNSEDLILRYDWLRNQIEQKPNSQTYTMTRKTRITLGMALNNYKWEQLGNIIDLTRNIELGWSNERNFPKLPNTGKQLLKNTYNSLPLDVSMLKVSEEMNK